MNWASRGLLVALIVVSTVGSPRAAQQTANASRPIESFLEIPQLDATIRIASLKHEATLIGTVMGHIEAMTRLSVYYDESVPELTKKWTGNLVDVPLDKALDAVLKANGIAFTILGPKQVFAYSDNAPNREKYQWSVRTFPLAHADPNTLAAYLNRQFTTITGTGIRPIIVPSNLAPTLPPRSITVRATGEKMALIAKVIAESDKAERAAFAAGFRRFELRTLNF